MVASDRISAYDFVLDTTIPDKGEILTRMSLWWFDQLADLVPQPRACPPTCRPPVARPRGGLRARSTMFPVECVARGYLTGSGLLDYQPHRRGLRHRAARRAWSGRQPAARADLHPGHQGRARRPRRERLLRGGRRATVGDDAAAELRDAHPGGLRAAPRQLARERGIILADTKLEFGRATPPTRRSTGPGRRGAHPRLLPLLAGRRLAAGSHAGVVRQADRARLAHRARVRLGPHLRRGAAAAARRRSSSAPAPATSRPTSCSPGSGSERPTRSRRAVDAQRHARGRPSPTSSTRATARSGSPACCRSTSRPTRSRTWGRRGAS